MRNLLGASLFFFLGLLGGALLIGTKSIPIWNSQNEVDTIKMRQTEASLRLLEKELHVCQSRFDLKTTNDESQMSPGKLLEVNKPSLASFSSSSLSSKGNDIVENDDKLRMEYLDKKIDDAPEDLEWTGAVDSSVLAVLTKWLGSEQRSIRCSHYVCRVEISAGRADQAEKIIDSLNNITEVQGERMIQFDEKNENAVVYFGRSGAISLLSGDGF